MLSVNMYSNRPRQSKNWHKCSGLELCSLPVCMPVYMTVGHRPILLLLLLLAGSLPIALLCCGVADVQLMLHYFHM